MLMGDVEEGFCVTRLMMRGSETFGGLTSFDCAEVAMASACIIWVRIMAFQLLAFGACSSCDRGMGHFVEALEGGLNGAMLSLGLRFCKIDVARRR